MKQTWWDTHRRSRLYPIEHFSYFDEPDIDDIVVARNNPIKKMDMILSTHVLDVSLRVHKKGFNPLTVVWTPLKIDVKSLENSKNHQSWAETFRRTNLICAFDHIDPQTCIYTDVTVFKDNNFKMVREEKLPILCGWIPNAKTSRSGQMYDDIIEKSIIQHMLEMMFKIAIKNGFDSIVIDVPPGPTDFITILSECYKKYPITSIFVSMWGLSNPKTYTTSWRAQNPKHIVI